MDFAQGIVLGGLGMLAFMWILSRMKPDETKHPDHLVNLSGAEQHRRIQAISIMVRNELGDDFAQYVSEDALMRQVRNTVVRQVSERGILPNPDNASRSTSFVPAPSYPPPNVGSAGIPPGRPVGPPPPTGIGVEMARIDDFSILRYGNVYRVIKNRNVVFSTDDFAKAEMFCKSEKVRVIAEEKPKFRRLSLDD